MYPWTWPARCAVSRIQFSGRNTRLTVCLRQTDPAPLCWRHLEHRSCARAPHSAMPWKALRPPRANRTAQKIPWPQPAQGYFQAFRGRSATAPTCACTDSANAGAATCRAGVRCLGRRSEAARPAPRFHGRLALRMKNAALRAGARVQNEGRSRRLGEIEAVGCVARLTVTRRKRAQLEPRFNEF